MRTTILIAAALIFGSPSIACAETHAVIVGIDKYRNVRSLKGAVADARDIDGALAKRGLPSGNRTLLVNEQATRRSVLGAIDKVVASVKRGDLVIISFAGHGAREGWGAKRPPGFNAGDLHEVFVLGDFSVPDAAGQINPAYGGSARERIAGAELNLRLRSLHEKGARTIFVADTCHGGGLAREPMFDEAGKQVSYRLISSYKFAPGQDPLEAEFSALPAPVDPDQVLTSLTFLAAVDKTQLAPEVPIPLGSSQARGALSYTFARLLEGNATTAKPNVITREEIFDFIMPNVKSLSGNMQTPDLRPRMSFEQVVIDFDRDLTGGSQQVPVPPPEPPPGTVRVAGANPADLQLAPPGVTITVTDDISSADLIVRDRSIFARNGDLVATNIRPADIVGAAEREVALRKLRALSLSRPREIRLRDGDKLYRKGQMVTLEAPAANRGNKSPELFVMINITGNGVIQYQYPLRDGKPSIVSRDRPLIGAVVVPPFGADTAVLVTSSDDLSGLADKLYQLNQRRNALEAVRLIEASIRPGLRIGLQSVFTAPAPN